MPKEHVNPKTQKTSYLPDKLSFFVSGFPYSDGKRGFDEKGSVTLVHEADNRYDSEALAVYIGITKVGYVPKPLNSFILHLLKLSTSRWTVSDFVASRAHSEIQITLVP